MIKEAITSPISKQNGEMWPSSDTEQLTLLKTENMFLTTCFKDETEQTTKSQHTWLSSCKRVVCQAASSCFLQTLVSL